MTYGNIFLALGDPTRRSVLEALRHQPMTVGMLAKQMPVSRPAVSQHLKILKEAELVTVTPKGASNEYALNRKGLDEIRAWLDSMWDDSLEAFKAHVDQKPENNN
ncbi:MAG: winged helix-turn-helix transcriptional regulator [Rhodospirillaceae bacterium]|jgi:DNA-binding transcriptional ArsR family regulator|nr:winged helix-turn-helix transcriptional regulator [Rhodospirillaceae bacterium]MBT4588520.1 winged helix-turn-helix transcriptional regulator [Rhodospirillaceae bacterium]MBT4941210.1 winged helix-turn-helix transcriptional regulator [Rhodospirillaceae bacterium]MBT5938538.1 winged helix-turn-helix transcriptional regulator [Rhodospirillaceae bacterium]MBT7268160.1 winged helix-turn-helix transcriptional regulator [Rhodospirillaceae bacterium]